MSGERQPRGFSSTPPSIPCECGANSAYWHGSTTVFPGRFYGCDRCWTTYRKAARNQEPTDE